MHKATFLEGTLRMTIQPVGPILIKAGESGGADPTLPDMEFVRTQGRVYIPGPSLKGVVRAHCERICRSLDSDELQARRQRRNQGLNRDEPRIPLADNPLGNGTSFTSLDDPSFMNYSSGRAIEAMELKGADRTAVVYRRSSFVSQIFGHTSLAGRVRFADAYAEKQPELEERNGVAIDRIYGSVAVGPFNYETAVSGQFATRIDLKNMTLAQLGLLGLALRDLAEGRVVIGFGKSRGLGRVSVTFDELSLFYPTCTLDEASGALRLLGGREVAVQGKLVGLGALCAKGYLAYGLPEPGNDIADLPIGLAYAADEFMGVRLLAQGDAQVRALWKQCMGPWRKEIGL